MGIIILSLRIYFCAFDLVMPLTNYQRGLHVKESYLPSLVKIHTVAKAIKSNERLLLSDHRYFFAADP